MVVPTIGSLLNTGITTEYVKLRMSSGASTGVGRGCGRLMRSAPGAGASRDQGLAEHADDAPRFVVRPIVVERTAQKPAAHVVGDRTLRGARRELRGGRRALKRHIVERRLHTLLAH